MNLAVMISDTHPSGRRSQWLVTGHIGSIRQGRLQILRHLEDIPSAAMAFDSGGLLNQILPRMPAVAPEGIESPARKAGLRQRAMTMAEGNRDPRAHNDRISALRQ